MVARREADHVEYRALRGTVNGGRPGMDARQLEYFLAIVDHDGFGRAAQHLHIAQPSLSQAIANLERELGIQLFHRIGRGVVLSTGGRAS